MSKYLRLVFVCLMISNPAWAACDGGEWIQGQDGNRFCRSDAAMNWWSAMVWCQQNGMLLTTITNICPDTTLSSGNACQNMRQGSGDQRYGWTRSLCGTGYAWTVDASNNGSVIKCQDRTAISGYWIAQMHALCEAD